MSTESLRIIDTRTTIARKPRIALMGEFSAGKSTLANFLLGHSMSPVKATATQLPPVCYTYGERSVFRVDNSGSEHVIADGALDGISHRDTQAVRIRLDTEALEFCDLIDMPGTSDPNMPQSVWERVIAYVDSVVWCTPATQAWRQSEAALWEMLPERLRASSLLLITRMDKLQNEVDRARVLARVRHEADGLFKAVLPISLTEALADPDDPAVLESAGADLFVENLVEIVETPGMFSADPGPMRFDALEEAGKAPSAAEDPQPGAPNDRGAEVVIPRRVVMKRARPRTRPVARASYGAAVETSPYWDPCNNRFK
ncbi:dynamin family protein [Aestuariicoccus sp. MJ-SS9]|uniref:dynamin family protein n=1 Tax=Aestuariicoccus sp. MJ-SS9 TaxID=3079855 RepID=UPI002907A3E7|nr:dynamin family protein [Aestuariicoccus sp. MJ-SS9]MDU8913552.1 dynamin family protein [Aestuariicoccus sp. MJ-SS9]